MATIAAQGGCARRNQPRALKGTVIGGHQAGTNDISCLGRSPRKGVPQTLLRVRKDEHLGLEMEWEQQACKDTYINIHGQEALPRNSEEAAATQQAGTSNTADDSTSNFTTGRSQPLLTINPTTTSSSPYHSRRKQGSKPTRAALPSDVGLTFKRVYCDWTLDSLAAHLASLPRKSRRLAGMGMNGGPVAGRAKRMKEEMDNEWDRLHHRACGSS